MAIDELPAPVVVEHDGFSVVRDDLIAGGTKVRVLIDILGAVESREIVYASHPFGYGSVALAHACKRVGKKLTLFFPRFIGTPKPYALACKHSHVSHWVVKATTRQIDLVDRVQEYAALHNAHVMPIGFDTDEFRSGLVSIARGLRIRPTEVWAVAGSGCLVRALNEAWPGSRVCAVSLGFPHVKTAGADVVYTAVEPPDQPASEPPPFPSAEHYDAKLWRFVKAHGQKGALVWNVA